MCVCVRANLLCIVFSLRLYRYSIKNVPIVWHIVVIWNNLAVRKQLTYLEFNNPTLTDLRTVNSADVMFNKIWVNLLKH